MMRRVDRFFNQKRMKRVDNVCALVNLMERVSKLARKILRVLTPIVLKRFKWSRILLRKSTRNRYLIEFASVVVRRFI